MEANVIVPPNVIVNQDYEDCGSKLRFSQKINSLCDIWEKRQDFVVVVVVVVNTSFISNQEGYIK